MDKIDLNRAVEASPELSPEVMNEINDLFEYHPWNDEQMRHGYEIRTILATAFSVLINHVPPCPQRTRALNMLHDARMLANAAITHKGKF